MRGFCFNWGVQAAWNIACPTPGRSCAAAQCNAAATSGHAAPADRDVPAARAVPAVLCRWRTPSTRACTRSCASWSPSAAPWTLVSLFAFPGCSYRSDVSCLRVEVSRSHSTAPWSPVRVTSHPFACQHWGRKGGVFALMAYVKRVQNHGCQPRLVPLCSSPSSLQVGPRQGHPGQRPR